MLVIFIFINTCILLIVPCGVECQRKRCNKGQYYDIAVEMCSLCQEKMWPCHLAIEHCPEACIEDYKIFLQELQRKELHSLTTSQETLAEGKRTVQRLEPILIILGGILFMLFVILVLLLLKLKFTMGWFRRRKYRKDEEHLKPMIPESDGSTLSSGYHSDPLHSSTSDKNIQAGYGIGEKTSLNTLDKSCASSQTDNKVNEKRNLLLNINRPSSRSEGSNRTADNNLSLFDDMPASTCSESLPRAIVIHPRNSSAHISVHVGLMGHQDLALREHGTGQGQDLYSHPSDCTINFSPEFLAGGQGTAPPLSPEGAVARTTDSDADSGNSTDEEGSVSDLVRDVAMISPSESGPLYAQTLPSLPSCAFPPSLPSSINEDRYEVPSLDVTPAVHRSHSLSPSLSESPSSPEMMVLKRASPPSQVQMSTETCDDQPYPAATIVKPSHIMRNLGNEERKFSDDEGIERTPPPNETSFSLMFQASNKAKSDVFGKDDSETEVFTHEQLSPKEVFSRFEYIEEYIHHEKYWEVNISPQYDREKAMQEIQEATKLPKSELDINFYESCDSEFEKHGDDSDEVPIQKKTAANRTPIHDAMVRSHPIDARRNKSSAEESPVDVDFMKGTNDYFEKQANPSYDSGAGTSVGSLTGAKFLLPVGDKILYKKLNNNNQTVLNKVTLGSFVKIITKDGNQMTCAQTSCEGACVGTDCYVCRYDTTDKVQKLVQFGRVRYTLEEKQLNHVSHDVMLIELTNPDFQPIMHIYDQAKNYNTLEMKLPSNGSRPDVNLPVKKLQSNNMDNSPDGIVKFKDITNPKHYFGMIAVSTEEIPSINITEKGDCGMLITGLPADNTLPALGIVYGSATRKDATEKTKEKFTVISPINDTFEELKRRHKFQSIDFCNAHQIYQGESPVLGATGGFGIPDPSQELSTGGIEYFQGMEQQASGGQPDKDSLSNLEESGYGTDFLQSP